MRLLPCKQCNYKNKRSNYSFWFCDDNKNCCTGHRKAAKVTIVLLLGLLHVLISILLLLLHACVLSQLAILSIIISAAAYIAGMNCISDSLRSGVLSSWTSIQTIHCRRISDVARHYAIVHYSLVPRPFLYGRAHTGRVWEPN